MVNARFLYLLNCEQYHENEWKTEYSEYFDASLSSQCVEASSTPRFSSPVCRQERLCVKLIIKNPTPIWNRSSVFQPIVDYQIDRSIPTHDLVISSVNL